MPKSLRTTIVTAAIAIVIMIVFCAGCIVGNDRISLQGTGLDVVEQVWDLLFSEYVENDSLDMTELSQGAIRGIMETLDDPYSSYLNQETYELSLSSIEGSFEGIGAYVGMRDEQITVIAPIAGSPAEQAGIKAGDIIVSVEGQSTIDLTLNEVVLMIRGPRGTSVTIEVIHEGESEPVELTITRDQIKLSSAYLEMMDDIAYLRITNFTDRTNEELDPIIDDIESNGATGIILDLRSNPGGLLTSVVDVTSRFVRNGYILHSRDNKGETTSYFVKDSGKKTDLPMVILTDNYTASASEVLSGALQDHERAVVAGTVTYGKGSVNTLYTLKDGSGIYITTHRWLTPNERLIEGEGITPDYPLEEENPIDWAIDYLHSKTP